MRKFKWTKLFTYLSLGLILLGTWSYVNYINYVDVNKAVQTQVSLNNVLIDSAVNQIQTKQDQLRMVQEIYVSPIFKLEAPSEKVFDSKNPVVMASPSEPVVSVGSEPVFDDLQSRIDKLEKEKQEYLIEKGTLKKEIGDVMSILKLNPKNPFINIVLLPLLGYLGKKLIDLLFKILEEKYHEVHHHHET